MTAYVVVEGHGETDAVQNLLARLVDDLGLALRFGAPVRAPRIHLADELARRAEAIRSKRDATALLVLRDDDDGCPREDGPRAAEVLRGLALPFPSAVTLAYREYESLFLPCITELAGVPFDAPGGLKRPGLLAGAHYEGDYEAKRDVKGWLSSQMPPGVIYKPSVDQLLLTRRVSFATVRASGLAWFGTLERCLRFLAENVGGAGAVYPSSPSPPRA